MSVSDGTYALFRGLRTILVDLLATMLGPPCQSEISISNFLPVDLAGFYLELPLSLQSDVLNSLGQLCYTSSTTPDNLRLVLAQQAPAALCGVPGELVLKPVSFRFRKM